MTKERALSLIRGGFILQIEAAKLMGVSRQRVHQWCQEVGIDAIQARLDYLHRIDRVSWDQAKWRHFKGRRMLDLLDLDPVPFDMA